MKTVLVTPRSLSEGNNAALARIRDAGYGIVFPSPGKQPTEDEIVASIGDAVGYLAGVERIGGRALNAARALRVISRNGVGVDNIDMDAAQSRGIRVLKAEGANARGVAELAIGHLLSAARGIAKADACIKSSRWARDKGLELEGKTLAVIGCGRIGKLVSRFALAFDMKIQAYDLYPDHSFMPDRRFKWSTLDEALRGADAITLHCPPTADGRPLLDRERIAALREGAIVVNTARESLVDEAAMIEALDRGHIRAYAIDAFDKEPPDDLSLVKNQKVIATPHLGGYTEESIERATSAAIDNLLRALSEAEA